MIRGIIFLLGLLVLFIGVMDKVQYKELATTPNEVTAEGAAALIAKEDEVFVRIKSSIDNRKIYPSSVNSPLYASCSPDSAVTISEKSDRSRVIGCRVKLDGTLETPQIEIVSVKKKKLQSDEETGRYFLAPVAGAKHKLWILSPFFPGANALDGQNWTKQKQYQGILTKLSDLNNNRAGLKKNVSELKEFFQRDFKLQLPDDALLIIDSENKGSAYDDFFTAASHVYVPVVGTSNSIFLMLNDSATVPSKIEGVLKSEPSEKFADFKNALGEDLPKQIGIITQWSGEQRNSQKLKEGMENVIIGLVLIGIAIVMTFVKKAFRRKKSVPK